MECRRTVSTPREGEANREAGETGGGRHKGGGGGEEGGGKTEGEEGGRRTEERGRREERGGLRVTCQHALQGKQHKSPCPKQRGNGEERQGVEELSVSVTPRMERRM